MMRPVYPSNKRSWFFGAVGALVTIFAIVACVTPWYTATITVIVAPEGALTEPNPVKKFMNYAYDAAGIDGEAKEILDNVQEITEGISREVLTRALEVEAFKYTQQGMVAQVVLAMIPEQTDGHAAITSTNKIQYFGDHLAVGEDSKRIPLDSKMTVGLEACLAFAAMSAVCASISVFVLIGSMFTDKLNSRKPMIVSVSLIAAGLFMFIASIICASAVPDQATKLFFTIFKNASVEVGKVGAAFYMSLLCSFISTSAGIVAPMWL
jgi:hypothetical protein